MNQHKERTRNRIQCAKCNTVIESLSRHDFKWCSCNSIYVDGGNDYSRMGGDLDDIFIVYDDDSIEPLRNQMSREKEEELIELARQVEKDDCPEELLPMNSDRLTMVEMDIDVFNEIINIQSEEIERLKQRIKVLESKQ